MVNKYKIVTTATPLRISFAGGGTDFKSYYSRRDGKVFSTTINKFVYVTVKRHSNLFEEKYRLNYSTAEICQNLNKIKNNITRECLKYLNINFPVYISTVSDIPTSSGLGSSSSFTVGLLHALLILKNKKFSLKELAEAACHIEINVLNKTQGKQDQYAATFGGLNKFTFKKNGNVIVKKLKLNKRTIKILNNQLFLVFTNQTRKAEIILKHQIIKFQSNRKYLDLINEQTDKLIRVTKEKEFKINIFSDIINKGWSYKVKLSKKILNRHLSKISKKIKKSGAIAQKLLGAGGGGFFLAVVPMKKIKSFILNSSRKTLVKFQLENEGTKVLFKR